MLFIYGAKVIYNKGKYYNYCLNENLWNRYLNFFDNITVCSRLKKQEQDANGESLSSHENVTFDCVDFYDNISLITKRNYINKHIIKLVKKADYVIARCPDTLANIGIKYARKYKKPYLVEMVGCPWDALWNHSFIGKLVAPYSFLKTKSVVKNASYVIYVTNEFLQKRYPTEGKNVGISDVLIPKLDSKILDKRLNKIKNLKDKIIIGTAAAVNVKYKGQQYVIKALAKLKKDGNTNFQYQMIGSGDESYLKNLAEKLDVKDQVTFLGSLAREEVFNWLDEIDIYIQPSETEGMPRALIEAMSRGLPACGTNVGGIPELIDDRLTFKKNSENDICELLTSFNKELMINQAKRNFNESKKYEISVIEEKRKEFFEKFLKDV